MSKLDQNKITCRFNNDIFINKLNKLKFSPSSSPRNSRFFWKRKKKRVLHLSWFLLRKLRKNHDLEHGRWEVQSLNTIILKREIKWENRKLEREIMTKWEKKKGERVNLFLLISIWSSCDCWVRSSKLNYTSLSRDKWIF
jgi:hypothetical protein